MSAVAVAIRWLAPASLAVCLVAGDVKSAAVMLLVCLGTTLSWRARRPALEDAICTLGLLLAAWSSVWQLYERWPGWDLAMHLLATGLLTSLALALADRRSARAPAPLGRRVLHGLAIGLALCSVWEGLELLGDRFVDPSIRVDPLDTAGDIVAGLVGAAVAAGLRRSVVEGGTAGSTQR